MSTGPDREDVNTESDLAQLQPLLAKQHDNYREMLQEPIDNSISATVESETYYQDPSPFTIQLDVERRKDTCRVIVADAGAGMSREVIRDYVFSTGDTNYSNGILNNIGAGLKASICWCENSLENARGPSLVENGFHLLSREPDAAQTQRVDGPVGAGIEVYTSTDDELWREGADLLPHHDHGTRVHLTCARQDFDDGLAPKADRLDTKLRYLQIELGVRFQHLLEAHEDNQILITYRDFDDDGKIEDQGRMDVVPISPQFKAKPDSLSIDEITQYESYEEFQEAVNSIDANAFGEEQYGWHTTSIDLEDSGQTFYISYEFGELDLPAMYEACDAASRNLIITSPNTKGFRWRYKWNQSNTGVDLYGNGRILNAGEWVFDLTPNPQYNGYCGMLRIIPAEPDAYELPTTNDKTGIEKSSQLWQKVRDWLNDESRTPVSTYDEGSSSDSPTDEESDTETESEDTTDSEGDSDDASSAGDKTSEDSGESDGSSGDSNSDSGPASTTKDGETDTTMGRSEGSEDMAAADDSEELTDSGADATDEDSTSGAKESRGSSADESAHTTAREMIKDQGGENIRDEVEVEEVTIDIVAYYPGAGDILNIIRSGTARPGDVYKAMLCQDHYKRKSDDYEGIIIWADDISDIAERDLETVATRKDEHDAEYAIQFKELS